METSTIFGTAVLFGLISFIIVFIGGDYFTSKLYSLEPFVSPQISAGWFFIATVAALLTMIGCLSVLL